MVLLESLQLISHGRKDTPLNKQKPKVDPRIEKYIPWLKQQHFEHGEMTSHDGLKLKAKFLKADRDTIRY